MCDTSSAVLQVTQFPYLGRIKDLKSVMKTSTLQSKQMGKRENKVINIDGRVQFDLLQVSRAESCGVRRGWRCIPEINGHCIPKQVNGHSTTVQVNKSMGTVPLYKSISQWAQYYCTSQ